MHPLRYKNLLAAPGQSEIRDTFSRPNSTSDLGIADTGQAWTVSSGVWGIDASRAYASTPPGEAFVEAGIADVVVQAAITHGGDNGLVFRITGTGSFLMARFGADKVELYRKQSGTFTLLASVAYAIALGAIATLKVRAVGSAIEVYANDVLQISATEPFQATVTRHGLYAGTGAARWDDFIVVAV